MPPTVLWTVALACACALAAPVANDLLGDGVLLGVAAFGNGQPCASHELELFRAAMESENATALNCSSIVAEAGERHGFVAVARVCPCMEVLRARVKNLYDGAFDCTVKSDVLNIRQTLRRCGVPDDEPPVVVESKTPQKALATADNPMVCVQDINCFAGKCVGDVCVCHKAEGETHPRFVGAQCDVPWCELDCSGHGLCVPETGECRCDSSHVGRACQTAHPGTMDTRNVVVPQDAAPNASDAPDFSGRPCDRDVYFLPNPIERDPLVHVPQCTEEGTYEPRQCNAAAQECWCSQPNGVALEHTRSSSFAPPSEADCESEVAKAASGAPRYADLAVVPVKSDDPCASHFCGPNGYCDPSQLELGCICVGGFTGETCMVYPPVRHDEGANATES